MIKYRYNPIRERQLKRRDTMMKKLLSLLLCCMLLLTSLTAFAEAPVSVTGHVT